MRPLASSIIALSLCMGSTIVTYAAEELDAIRSSVWPPPRTETDSTDESHDDEPTPEPPRPDRSKNDPSNSVDFGSEVKEKGFYLLALGATAPFWGPPKLLDDEYDRKGTFFSFPYKRGRQGSMVLEPADDTYTKPWHLKLRGDVVNDFDTVYRAGGHFLFDTTMRLGLDGEMNYRSEQFLPDARDSLLTGDLNLLFRLAQTEFIQIRSGIGVNWLDDSDRDATGINFTYGADWTPADPWVISSEIDWGRVGEAGLFHGRLTVGIHYRHVELFSGYDYTDIGKSQMGGLVGGMRFWF